MKNLNAAPTQSDGSAETGAGRAGPGGDWPRTTRVLPWMIAGFVAMVWLVPIDSTFVPVHLPFDSTIDRVAMMALGFTWLIATSTGPLGPRHRRTPINLAILAFLAVAAASVALNLTGIARAEELQLALKKMSLLACYGGFFLIVATGVRRSELRNYLLLIVVLAVITAIGTVIEYRTGANYFYSWAGHLPFLHEMSPPNSSKYGRPRIVGPTQHGLADVTILGMVIPLALAGVMGARKRSGKILYGLAVALLFAGAVATLRKTALVVPLAGMLVLLIYQPRRMMRLLPLGIALIVFVKLISPGALSGILYQIEGGSKESNEGRTLDYEAVTPDVLSHPLTGRGYGTYDPKIQTEKHHKIAHRILDNQLLMILIESGIFGVLAYLAIGFVALRTLHRSARSSNFARAGPAVAVAAAICAYYVANLLFDTLAFPQVPYVFFLLLALSVVAATEDPAAAPEPRREALSLQPPLQVVRLPAAEVS